MSAQDQERIELDRMVGDEEAGDDARDPVDPNDQRDNETNR
jgi:hypothetical protein